MLIQFSVKNYKTFKDQATINMLASPYDVKVREKENLFHDKQFNMRLLKSAVIYGANASGKSKFYDAMHFARNFVLESAKDYSAGDTIPVEPFLLNKQSERESSEFEFIFLLNNARYRYGFEVDQEEVKAEWLYVREKTKEVEWFYRDFQSFMFHNTKFRKAYKITKEGFVRNNQLLISVATQFNDNLSESIFRWFKGFKNLSGLEEHSYQGYSMSLIEDQSKKSKVLDLLKFADLAIEDIELEMLNENQIPTDLPPQIKERLLEDLKDKKKQIVNDVRTHKRFYNEHGLHNGSKSFSMDEQESSGTRKFFALTGPILDVLENGYTLVVDELDSKLHPNLVERIVALFSSRESNPNNAQLIFNTHNTNLLSSGFLRRDQIWFVEKNKRGEAQLFSLSDIKNVRAKEALEDNYLKGKYGAVPYLNSFNEINAEYFSYENERQKG